MLTIFHKPTPPVHAKRKLHISVYNTSDGDEDDECLEEFLGSLRQGVAMGLQELELVGMLCRVRGGHIGWGAFAHTAYPNKPID